MNFKGYITLWRITSSFILRSFQSGKSEGIVDGLYVQMVAGGMGCSDEVQLLFAGLNEVTDQVSLRDIYFHKRSISLSLSFTSFTVFSNRKEDISLCRNVFQSHLDTTDGNKDA